MIECFLHTSQELRDRFETLIKDKPENEHLRIAKQLAMDAHKELHDQNETFKEKVHNQSEAEKKVANKKYVPQKYVPNEYPLQPDKTPEIEKIKSDYQSQIDEANKTTEVPIPETKTGTTDESVDKVVEPTGEGKDEGKTVGVSHESLQKVADKIGLEEPKRGTFLSPEQQTERGRQLLKGGADPEQVKADFEKDGKVSADEISVARAHFENLIKAADKAMKDFGKNSKEFKEALDKANQWEKDVVKPMGTSSGAAFSALQGETDLDTGSFVSVKKAVESKTGKPLTPEQEATITDLTNKNNELSKKLEDLQKKFTETVDKSINEEQKTKKTTKKNSGDYAKERKDAFQAARDALKQLRSGQSGLGVTVPFARELAAIAPHVAKIVKSLIEEGIDKLGDIVDQLHDEFKDDIKGLRRRDILDVIVGDHSKKQEQKSPEINKLIDIKKQGKLLQKLQDLQEGLPEDHDKNITQQSPETKKLLEQIKKVKKDLKDAGYMEKPITEAEKNIKAAESNIKRLQKQLDDFWKDKPKNITRELTEEEKDLKDKIKYEQDLLKELNKSKDRRSILQENKEDTHFMDLVTKFADKTGNTFTPEEVKDIWDYAKKNYIDKGRTVNEMLKGVSMDLGLTSKQVLSALEQPKGAKAISDQMFLAQSRRLQASNKVKEYAQAANQSKLSKWLKAIPNFFFQKAIFGHGTVGMITHAGLNIFRPTIAKAYWPLFFKQFKNSFGSLTDKGLSNYEKDMDHLKNDPMFVIAKRAGAKVDPTDPTNDEYTGLKKWLGKIGAIGDRGFNTLKEFRLAYFKSEYNRLSEVQKADPATLKELGKLTNHATGTSSFQPGEAISTAVFAPKLEVSKWARVVTDPAKAITTFTKWNNATMAEKAAAKIIARKSGEFLATYIGALAINQALLSATGSKQTINYTDPTKKDYLKFKAGDEIIDLSGGIIPTTQFVGHLLVIPFESKKDLKGKSRTDELMKTGWNYATSKASPFAGTAKDIITAHDFSGNTLPWSDDKPLNQYAHKLTWKEYLLTQQAPIPMAEASKDIYKSLQERGMDDLQIRDVLTGLAKGAISGGTGAKVGEDFSLKQIKTEDKYSDETKKFLDDKKVEVPTSRFKYKKEGKEIDMTQDEATKFTKFRNEYIDNEIKKMLTTRYDISEENRDGVIVNSASVLGKDLDKYMDKEEGKTELQKKIEAISKKATELAKTKIGLEKTKNQVLVEEH